MKNILNQMILTWAMLLLLVASGSAQILAPVYSFSDTNDINPAAVGLLLSGNTLYGTIFGAVYNGGGKSNPNLPGAIFKLNPDGTGFTNLYVFSKVDQNSLTNIDGANPPAPLLLSGNQLYGVTEFGGFNHRGTVFAINPDGTGFTNLYNFSAEVVDGVNPSAGLVASGSKLYGTTSAGGIWGGGTVFALNPDGTGFTNLYSFNPANGDGSGSKPMILSGNTLYGTTSSGGSSGNGTVFALNTDGGSFTNLHNFSSLVRETASPFAYTNNDGSVPQSGLVLAGNVLYGTAMTGGSFGYGTVFAIHTDGTSFTNLHSFNVGDGENPSTSLALSGNTLYGVAHVGGSLGNEGTVFSINTDGTAFATLDSFTVPALEVSGTYTNASGAVPVANMVLSGTTLYGATEQGGTNGRGTIFALNPSVALPTIQFTATPTNGVPPLTVHFSSPAVDAGGNAILAWNWNFGDGSNSVAQNPSHTYTNPATFLPTLTCINNNGSTVIGSGAAIAAAYPSSILNGGFETGTFTNWTATGYYFYSGVTTGSKYAHTGAYGAALETGGTPGFLSQTLATTPGAAYLISFWLDSPAATTPNDFQVSWNGSVLLDKTNVGNIGWTNIQLTATAAAAGTTLQFGYLNGYFYFGLDDVSVVPVTHPELASISLSGSNLVLNGINGVSGTTNYLLMGTNLMQPRNQWTRIATNILGANGNFTVTATNVFSPNAPGRFYLLQLQ